ncbi:hypothetical protein P280DRAFT_454369 [Massarina eburnea CBS 473.64]|uniref:Uncharacterized protein n=1 Tax=Massarina eburnea CBS 473.64 TaxID=1395130 RepID=A0A6A6RXR8_9PLEO|nr:hypothetical protein P280DRAFT_454369 [Massarina eburnea CBS 473.64]
MRISKQLPLVVSVLAILAPFASAAAPSDSPRDADPGQSGYIGGDHSIDPATVSQFKQLWNLTLHRLQHSARPLVHTLQSGKQVIFTASTENIIRSIDAKTGDVLAERQVAQPWAMSGASCETVSKNMGIMGTPVLYPEYDVAFFYAKSYIEDYRVPGGATAAMNGVYYLYAVYVETLLDVYKFPIIIDDYAADNDARKIFLGGLVAQRPALTLLNDVVYAGFGGLCDSFNYTGTVVAININTRWVNRWVTQAGPGSSYSEDWTLRHGGGAGGVAQYGMGIATDGQDVYFSVDSGGVGTDKNATGAPVAGHTHQDVLSDSAVRVKLTDDGVQFVDFFRPYDAKRNGSQELESGGFSMLDPTVFRTDTVAKLGVSIGGNAKLYIHDLDNLGGYRQGANGSDGVLQIITLDGGASGGVGSYPLEGGYMYVTTANGPLAAYEFTPNSTTSLFTLAGKSSALSPHSDGVGIPTVTSKNGEPGTGTVWLTDPIRGLLAYQAVPVNGSLVEVHIGGVNTTAVTIQGAGKYSRPVFGDGRVYIVDGAGRLVALGT